MIKVGSLPSPMHLKQKVSHLEMLPVMAKGIVKVNDKFMFKDVALVENLKFNLLSVS